MARTPRRSRPATAAGLCLAGAALVLFLGGCSLVAMRPGGNMRSDDRFTWVSTTYQPYSITLLDTRTGEELWAIDVPVGQKLTVQFYENKAKLSPPETPAMMRWELIPETQMTAPLRNTMNVPPAHARRLDVTIRTTPEFPPAPREPLPEIPAATAGVGSGASNSRPAPVPPAAAPQTPAAAPAARPTPVQTPAPTGPAIRVEPISAADTPADSSARTGSFAAHGG